MDQIQVAVILGSETDQPILVESKLRAIFEAASVTFEASIISAHRNPVELEEYCVDMVQNWKTKIFIGAAGKAAVLPGLIVTILSKYSFSYPVLGVPLTHPDSPDGYTATRTMLEMPSGSPVAVFGVNKAGFENAALHACAILGIGDDKIHTALAPYRKQTEKSAKIDILGTGRTRTATESHDAPTSL